MDNLEAVFKEFYISKKYIPYTSTKEKEITLLLTDKELYLTQEQYDII